jgi:hypothetical protein
MERATFIAAPTYEDYVLTDGEARRITGELLHLRDLSLLNL